jgi:hypothetical protein
VRVSSLLSMYTLSFFLTLNFVTSSFSSNERAVLVLDDFIDFLFFSGGDSFFAGGDSASDSSSELSALCLRGDFLVSKLGSVITESAIWKDKNVC